MKEIMSYLPDELEIEPKFRKKQIFNWIYDKYVENFDDMKNLPKDLREKLKTEYIINPLTIINREIATDGTEKFLFGLKDGHTVETVLLRMKEGETDDEGNIISEDRYTVCVSCQVGCKVGCSFCLTAKGGFVRNLTPAEIVAQVWMMDLVATILSSRFSQHDLALHIKTPQEDYCTGIYTPLPKI
jgi:23S rRNA (adenine2503-C2)-methyltransferase